MRENRRGAAGAVIAVVLILLPILLMSGSLDSYGGRGLRVGVSEKIDKVPLLKDITNLPSTAKKWVEEATQNPFAEKETASTEVSTKTSAGTGVKVKNDQADRTGILSPNPRSEQEYTILVGVRNPTRDFVASGSKLTLGNPENVTNRTGLVFEPFSWDGGGAEKTIEPSGYNNYASASANSIINPKTGKKTAIKVSSTTEVGPTNIPIEVDYSYDFKSAYKLNLTGIPENALVMYHMKIIVGSDLLAPYLDRAKVKDVYKITEEAAGGPVVVSRAVVEPYLLPDKKLNLIFTIKNADANGGEVFEAIDFKGGPTSSKIILKVPDELAPVSSNLMCNDLAGPYQQCTIVNLLQGSNIKKLRETACGPDGCLFHNYDVAQGFSESDNRILTDESGNDELGFTVTFKVPSTIDRDGVYNIYLIFKEGAYTYHAAIKKGVGVQPG